MLLDNKETFNPGSYTNQVSVFDLLRFDLSDGVYLALVAVTFK